VKCQHKAFSQKCKIVPFITASKRVFCEQGRKIWMDLSLWASEMEGGEHQFTPTPFYIKALWSLGGYVGPIFKCWTEHIRRTTGPVFGRALKVWKWCCYGWLMIWRSGKLLRRVIHDLLWSLLLNGTLPLFSVLLSILALFCCHSNGSIWKLMRASPRRRNFCVCVSTMPQQYQHQMCFTCLPSPSHLHHNRARLQA